MLIEACSIALAEFRGIYKDIGERTIRDDIRIMRSEILGFNAPILYNNGYYSYSEPEYSIFNTTIGEKKLLTKILKILLEEWKNIDHPDILEVVIKLSRITGFSLPSGINSNIYYQKANQIEEDIAPTFEQRTLKAPLFAETIEDQMQDYTEIKEDRTESLYSLKKPKKLPWFTMLFRGKTKMLPIPYSWQSILNLLGPQSVKK